MSENDTARIIVDVAYHIHARLGPGLLESVYQTVMAHELCKRGRHVLPKEPMPLIYDDLVLDKAYEADLIVDGLVIVEIKSVEIIAPVHYKQLLTYLRLADKRLGLLINFGAGLIKNGICRIVNGLAE